MKVFDWIQDLCLSCYCSGADSASLGDSYFGFLNFSSYTKSLKKRENYFVQNKSTSECAS